MPKVLIVDDDKDFVDITADLLRREGWEAAGVFSGEEALQVLGAEKSDAVLLDLVIPGGMGGEATLIEIKKRAELENLCVVILTGYGNVSSAVRTMRLGAYQYVQKPFQLRDLMRLLASGIAWQRAHALRRSILASLDTDVLIGRIGSIVRETLNPPSLCIALLAPDGKAIAGDPPDVARTCGVHQRRFVQHLKETRQALFEHGPDLARWDPVLPEARSLLAAPVLRAGGNLAGIIHVESPVENAFDRSWVEVLQYLADLAGISIETAEAAARVLKSERESHERVLEAERESLHQIRTFVRELGHYISTPTQVIKLQAQMLASKELKAPAISTLPPELVSGIEDRLQMIERNADAITRVRDYLHSASEQIEVTRRAFDLAEVLDLCVEECRTEVQDKAIEIQVRNRPAQGIPLEGDVGLIGYSLQCLLRNAVEAIEERRRLEGEPRPNGAQGHDRIAVTLHTADPARVSVSIQDTGVGIPPENMERLFRPLFSTKQRAEPSGMGLFSVKRILVRHNGSIDVASRPGEGATFTIALPRN